MLKALRTLLGDPFTLLGDLRSALGEIPVVLEALRTLLGDPRIAPGQIGSMLSELRPRQPELQTAPCHLTGESPRGSRSNRLDLGMPGRHESR